MREAVLGVIIAFTYSFLIVSTTSAPVKCDFGNLQNVIGHKNFSLLGATPGCELFHLDGELVDFTNSFAIITGNFLQRNTLVTCDDERPNFYTNNNRFEVLVTSYDRLWLTNGNWTEAKPGFYTMPFESVMEGKSITPRLDNRYYVPSAGFVVDAFSDLGHFIAMDEDGLVDVPIRISNGEILQRGAITNDNKTYEPIGLDSDLKRLYFKMEHPSDCFDVGYFDVSTGEDNILTLGTFVSMNWKPCNTLHMSFSNNFVIALEETPRSWRYYISKDGDKPECFLEEQTLYPIIIQLFVGSMNGKSLHDKIREQFRPSESIQMQNSERTTTIDVLVDPGMTETGTANSVRNSTSAEETPSEPSKHADSERSDFDDPSSLSPTVEQPPELTTTGVPSTNDKRLAEMVEKVVGPPSASGPGLIAIRPLLVSMLAGYFFI